MPEMTRQQVIEAISDGRIAAVTIDTTVFDSKQRDFRRTDFRSISQIRTRHTPILITDVIASEMMAHLEVEAADTQRALKTALRSNNLRWFRQSPAGEHTALFIDKDPAEFARSEFDDFVKVVGAEVIKVADTPDGLAELFRRYFAVQTPFGKKETRKQEFPDAAALLCLEEYAKAKGKLVICVAQDSAWKDFAAKSEHLVTVFPLTEALGIYSEAFEDADLADKIVELWLDGDEKHFEGAVRDAIVERLTYIDYDVDANCSVEFEAEPMDAKLKEILMGTLAKPVVLAADDNTVTFSVEVDIQADFEANFSFSVWDSLDRESVSMGSEYVATTTDVPVHLTIVADRDVTNGIVLHEIEVSQKTFTVDFGYVDAFPVEEPDYD
ncbi:hypothetical protein F9L00_23585 [Brucella anthropi]|uniref:DUF4935 domain-containing protein n=1 Tax=Brucella tritici TaxID=94626 RepID=A0A7V7VQE5_9HYPH|nr:MULTISPECIES: PIN domain-containing protein [Brucella/Ochrobactrum group]KAB2654780.1 hypothetical protein F9K94_23060 [Brucella tritici]KAB2757503.1 hypothetical protein F9K98_22780 [Brucella anthropi]KAB2773885.1 hypothetical protein F9L00_23585 [Brucella anthropi]MCQ9147539.1 DUF4935 domain-containing protein [Ochrobactrum sp. BTU2]UGQ24481.1 PIN domain-containing protein [Brucella anthropi]